MQAKVLQPLGLALGALIALWLGVLIVRTGLALQLDQDAPDAALSWRPDDPDALTAVADARLSSGAPAEAADYARRALRSSPGDAAAFRILAQAAFLSGDENKGGALMEQGGRLSRRDPAIAYWLYRDALLQRRYTMAALQADALMRRAPRTVGVIVPDLRASLGAEGASEAVVQRLALQPPWRGAFLDELTASAPPYVALEMLTALADTAAPPSTDELSALFTRMVSDGDAQGAQQAWASFLPPAERPAPNQVFDESFRYPVAPSPFGWRLKSQRGSLARLDPQSGPGLRISLDGFSQSLLAYQMLTLSPGGYRLASNGRLLEGLAGGLQWQITCLNADAPLTQLKLSPEARTFAGEAAFQVPAGCPVQQLSLFGMAYEPEAPSTLMVDRVHVEPAA